MMADKVSDGAGRGLRVLVTGAARGLGRSIVEHLADHGHRVVACDVAPEVKDCSRSDGSVTSVCLDIAPAQAAARLVDAAVEVLGGLDALVNNAGVGGPGRLLAETADADLEYVLAVNLLAPTRLCREAVPHLRLSSRGRIVNIGSFFANHPQPYGAAYSASKGGLAALTRCLAVEEGAHGITVNTISPGYMLTGMHREEVAVQAAANGVDPEIELDRVRAQVPLGRHGTGADVAGTVAWLLSTAAGYVSGQDIPVNGAAGFG